MDLEILINLVLTLFEKWGYLIIFLGSLIEITPFGWMIPGGAILLVAGYISNITNTLPLVPVIAIGTFGAWMAFALAYWLGRKTGMWFVIKLKQEHNAKLAKTLLQNHGGMILTTSMLANLTRFWISYIAGTDRYSFAKFSLYGLIASLSWVSLMVLLGYFAGYEAENLKRITSGIGILAWVLFGVSAWVIYKYVKAERKIFVEAEIKEAEPRS